MGKALGEAERNVEDLVERLRKSLIQAKRGNTRSWREVKKDFQQS